ncbi:hypothetical protein BKP64_11105 [Marinobacter salinus]|uniref:Uncharacterized protein n=1 Tax=Marinobacter salinus TaxID=1874317 RepID=A0A1D9GMD1_9GAMM|nr:hypothetical protein BKP64_11105 [Marinobacter salinus]
MKRHQGQLRHRYLGNSQGFDRPLRQGFIICRDSCGSWQRLQGGTIKKRATMLAVALFEYW